MPNAGETEGHGRHSELDAREAWNAGAEAFIQFVDSGADYYRKLVHGPALFKACGGVRRLRALDLGCGHGYFSRELALAGAAVTAVDISDTLIARAIEVEAARPLGITYLRLDAVKLADHFDGESFDLVTACMSLQDMSDPAAVMAQASRVLGRAGRIVFSVPHPCTDPPVREWIRDSQGHKLALSLDRYFDSGPAVCNWNMPRLQYAWRTPFRRLTLTEWSALVQKAGLAIRSLSEPRPDASVVADHPELDDCFRMPFFLIFDVVKLLGAHDWH